MIWCGTKKASPETQVCVCVCVLFHPQTFLWKSLAEYQPCSASSCSFSFFCSRRFSLFTMCVSVPAMAIRISITKYSMSIQKRRMEISLTMLLRDSREKQTHAYRLIETHGGYLAWISFCWLAWHMMFSINVFDQLIVNSSTEFVEYFATTNSSTSVIKCISQK